MIQLLPRDQGFVEISTGQRPGVSGSFDPADLEIGEVEMEIVALPKDLVDPQRPEGTHLIAIKTAGEGEGWGLLFGGEMLIDTMAILCPYDPKTQKLLCFHCTQCAVHIIHWFKSKQREWEPIYTSGIDEATGKRPKRSFS